MKQETCRFLEDFPRDQKRRYSARGSSYLIIEGISIRAFIIRERSAERNPLKKTTRYTYAGFRPGRTR
jgi:hypothetical protein